MKLNGKWLGLVALAGFMAMGAANAESQMEINEREGKIFLEQNAVKEGVVTTDSGLQYKVLREGTGKQPNRMDTVKVNYEGRHLNGEVFDSSYQRGKPATFPLNRVIKGWTEGVQLMKEGAKYRLYVPYKLGYGDTGAGRKIGPRETLIFDVELISVN
jgi:FKBP-type peptidyl-prolyl cis-trans isomerase